jgi:hypothetical protein
MVGPFIFLDHMGPAAFAPGAGIDVRPHPHIGLATVTYLFEGELVALPSTASGTSGGTSCPVRASASSGRRPIGVNGALRQCPGRARSFRFREARSARCAAPRAPVRSSMLRR